MVLIFLLVSFERKLLEVDVRIRTEPLAESLDVRPLLDFGSDLTPISSS